MLRARGSKSRFWWKLKLANPIPKTLFYEFCRLVGQRTLCPLLCYRTSNWGFKIRMWSWWKKSFFQKINFFLEKTVNYWGLRVFLIVFLGSFMGGPSNQIDQKKLFRGRIFEFLDFSKSSNIGQNRTFWHFWKKWNFFNPSKNALNLHMDV